MELKKCVKNENSTCDLEILLAAADVEAACAKAYKNNGKKYRVQGFRPGKAPRKMIERLYGEDVFVVDAINDMFPDAYEAAIVAGELQEAAIGQPRISDYEKTEEGIVLKVSTDLYPEVELGEYKGMTVEKTAYTVGDAEVEGEIERLRERNSRTVEKTEGKAALGDIADLDYEGFIDGVAFEGGKAEGYPLELGSGSFIPGFEDGVIGHEIGEEFEINVKFPEEYHADMAGKDATFKIKLNGLKVKEMPEADDEFAKDVSEFDTLDELKADLKKHMQENLDSQAELKAENDLLEKICSEMKVAIPQTLMDAELEQRVQDFAYRMQQQGLDLDTYFKYSGSTMETFKASFTEQAEKQIRIRLALEKIAELEAIEISEEELETEGAKLAEQYGIPFEKMKEVPNAMVQLSVDLRNNKTVDFVKTNNNIVIAEEKKEEAPAEEAPKKTTRKRTKKTEAETAE